MSLLSLAKLTLTAHLNPISNSSSCREAPSHLSLIQFDWPSLWAMLDGTLCEVDRAFYPALVEGDLSVHFWLCSEKKKKLVKRSCLCHCVPLRGRLSNKMNNLPFIDISDTQRRDRGEITGLCWWVFSKCLRNMSHKCKSFVFTLFDLEMISRLYFFLSWDARVGQPPSLPLLDALRPAPNLETGELSEESEPQWQRGCRNKLLANPCQTYQTSVTCGAGQPSASRAHLAARN